jgi:hypothetical protein
VYVALKNAFLIITSDTWNARVTRVTYFSVNWFSWRERGREREREREGGGERKGGREGTREGPLKLRNFKSSVYVAEHYIKNLPNTVSCFKTFLKVSMKI